MTTNPSLEDLIAASVLPDIEEDIPFSEILEENDEVTSGAASLDSSTVFPPVESSFFGPSSRTEAENIQHLSSLRLVRLRPANREQEHDEKLRLHWEAEKAAMRKTPPKVVKANNPDELLKKAKEYMATPKEPKHTDVMRTPDRRSDSYGSSSGSRGLPRSPHTNSLFDYYPGRKNWGKAILFGTATTIGDHVIRYEPSDPEKDQGFRTIMIPVYPSTTLEKLIESKLVGKGQILSAQMLDVRAIKGMDGKNMARIIFVNEPKWMNDEDAMRSVFWCAEAPAYKVTTKTWPITEKLIADIARGYTRVLSLYGIENINRFSVPEVLEKKKIQPATSLCHYKRNVRIVSSATDEHDKITIEFNSIGSASGVPYWIQKEMRDLGKTPLKFRFEKDNTMTADVFAAHIEFGSNADVTENAPDGPRTRSARYPIRPIRKNTPTNILIPGINGANAVVSGDVDQPVVDDAMMNEAREPSAMHSVDTTSIAATAPASTDTNHQDIAASEALRPDTILEILKNAVPGFPRTIAYQPPMNRNTSPAKVPPGGKKFSFAPFLTTQGMYPDGPDDADRRGHYERKPGKADSYLKAEDIAELEALRKEAEKKKDEKSPGFVYSHEDRGRPQTPGPPKGPKMGLYKSKTGFNWDEDDDDDFACPT